MEDVNLLLKGYKEEAVCSNVRIEFKKKIQNGTKKKKKKKITKNSRPYVCPMG